jgi:hypothetical protein
VEALTIWSRETVQAHISEECPCQILVQSKDTDTHVHQTWVILAASAAHELFVLRLIFRQEGHNNVDAAMFYEALVTTNEIRAASVRPCHESDLVATDRLYLQKSVPYQIIIYHIPPDHSISHALG